MRSLFLHGFFVLFASLELSTGHLIGNYQESFSFRIWTMIHILKKMNKFSYCACAKILSRWFYPLGGKCCRQRIQELERLQPCQVSCLIILTTFMIKLLSKMTRCAMRCCFDEKCLSFEFSEKERRCNLNKIFRFRFRFFLKVQPEQDF